MSLSDVIQIPPPAPRGFPDLDPKALEHDLAEDVDGEVRFDPGSRGPTPRTPPTTDRCRSGSSCRAASRPAWQPSTCALGTARPCCPEAEAPALVGSAPTSPWSSTGRNTAID